MQNDNTKESWYWYEPMNNWVEMEAPYQTIEHLAEMMRKGRDVKCILDCIDYTVQQKYA
jgi:hypothetical protein